jgi:RND family efflux transporter MFP subunit
MKPESFRHFIEVNGRLEAEEDAFISPEMNGQIEGIFVKEGDEVKKGQLLVSLNTSLIESNIREVKTGLELAEKLYEKQKGLWEQNIGSELQYLEAKNAKEQAEARLATLEAQLDMARIKAPFSGVVETIMMKEGELAIPGMQLVQMLSLGSLKIYGNVSERYMNNVAKGDIVLVSFPDVAGLSLRAPIHRVGNIIDNSSRTFRIEVKVDNHKRKLKPNMYSLIRINDFSSERALVIPSMAIKQDIRGSYVYLSDTGEQKARKRYITPGLSYEDRTMVLEGLEEGDNVIVKGFAQVSDGVDIAHK